MRKLGFKSKNRLASRFAFLCFGILISCNSVALGAGSDHSDGYIHNAKERVLLEIPEFREGWEAFAASAIEESMENRSESSSEQTNSPSEDEHGGTDPSPAEVESGEALPSNPENGSEGEDSSSPESGNGGGDDSSSGNENQDGDNTSSESEDGDDSPAGNENEGDDNPSSETETEDGDDPSSETETEDGDDPSSETETEDGDDPSSETETEDGDDPSSETETEDGDDPSSGNENQDGNLSGPGSGGNGNGSSQPGGGDGPGGSSSEDQDQPTEIGPGIEVEQPPVVEEELVSQSQDGEVWASNFAELQAYLEEPEGYDTIVIINDIVLENTLIIPADVSVRLTGEATLTLADSFGSGERHFIVQGILIIEDGITLDGNGIGGGITVEGNGSLVLAGTITNCRAAKGGGILVIDGGYLEFAGGVISDCSADQGGGLYVSSAFDMVLSGGSIEGCEARLGGGIYLNNERRNVLCNLAVDMLISDCRSVGGTEASGGGGVYVKRGTFKMTANSQIIGCTSTVNGGGIASASSGIVEIDSGSTGFTAISHCEAESNGGGIWSAGSVVIYSGTIEFCTAVVNGGGIYMDSDSNSPAILTMSGGVIRNCAAESGGGVYLNQELSQFLMEDGLITECMAALNGGGVAINGGKLIMGDSLGTPVIESCTAGSDELSEWGGNGGGIYVSESGEVLIQSGTIQYCQAIASGDGLGVYGSGGGLFFGPGSVGSIQQAYITGCTAQFHGGGVFIGNYENLETTGAVFFSENTAMFYRKPADHIVNGSSGYRCTEAGSVSPSNDELGGRLYPLNNYDINYLSYSVIYYGNGGGLSRFGARNQYEVVTEYAPFKELDYIPEGYEIGYQVLSNNRSDNGRFEFIKNGSNFGIWSSTNIYIPEDENYSEYRTGDYLTFSLDELMENPVKELNALWKKDVRVHLDVGGAYADLNKEFQVIVRVVDARGNDFADNTYVLNLKHGETSETISIYEDGRIILDQDASETIGYRISYEDSLSTAESYQSELLSSYSVTEPVTITVRNTRDGEVPTGVSAGEGQQVLMIGGILGMMMWFVFDRWINCFRRRKAGYHI